MPVDAGQHFDRYRLVGLRGNPFAAAPPIGGPAGRGRDESGIGAWFVDRGVTPPPSPGSRTLVQVIGAQGMGKSTHLAEWRRLRPGPYHYIPRRPYRARWHTPPVELLVYGDEIDRMPIPLRTQWFSRLAGIGATVAIGTHRDLTGIARRAGFEVRTHHLRPVSRAELVLVLERRLSAASVSASDQPTMMFTEADVDSIFAECGGNLRAADAVSHRVLAERVRQVADAG